MASNLLDVDFKELGKAFESSVDMEVLTEAQNRIKVETINGPVNLREYDSFINSTLAKYFKYETAYKVLSLMKKQAKGEVARYDVMSVLTEMARLEVEHGLKPIVHVIPVENNTYIKADGYLYYGKRTGKLLSLEWKTEGKETICIVKYYEKDPTGKINISQMEGTAQIKENKNSWADDPVEKAKTVSMRRALRKAFPIGANDEPSEEPLINNNDIPVINSGANIENLSELVIENNKTPKEPVKDEVVKEVPQEVKELPKEEPKSIAINEDKLKELKLKSKRSSIRDILEKNTEIKISENIDEITELEELDEVLKKISVFPELKNELQKKIALYNDIKNCTEKEKEDQIRLLKKNFDLSTEQGYKEAIKTVDTAIRSEKKKIAVSSDLDEIGSKLFNVNA